MFPYKGLKLGGSCCDVFYVSLCFPGKVGGRFSVLPPHPFARLRTHTHQIGLTNLRYRMLRFSLPRFTRHAVPWKIRGTVLRSSKQTQVHRPTHIWNLMLISTEFCIIILLKTLKLCTDSILKLKFSIWASACFARACRAKRVMPSHAILNAPSALYNGF